MPGNLPPLCPNIIYAKIDQLLADSLNVPHPNLFQDQLILTYQRNTLTGLKNAFHPLHGQLLDNNLLANNLADFLKSHWDNIKGTCLSYTALPYDQITLLLCDVARLTGKMTEKKKPAIHLLMPGVATTSCDEEDYPHLDSPELDLHEILKTHILGQHNAYLVPVKQWVEIVENQHRNAKSYNYYYDNKAHRSHPEMLFLSPGECARLKKHSGLTQSLYDTQEYTIQKENEQNDFLSSLRQLCKQLRFNDAHGGIGQQRHAGEGAYAAIIRFNAYFQQMTPQQKQQIPQELLDEINLLIKLSFDQQSNIQGDTCIGTRRERLEKFINTPQIYEVLRPLSITTEQQEQQLSDARQTLEDSRNSFHSALNAPKYKGKDHLPLTSSLMNWLDVQLVFRTAQDVVSSLMQLNIESIQLILQNNAQRRAISNQFSEKNHLLALLFSGHESEKTGLILQLLATEKNAALKTHFVAVMEYLTPGQLIFLLDEFKPHLRELLPPAQTFLNVLRYLSIEQRTLFLEACKTHLNTIIHHTNDLIELLSQVEPEQGTELLRYLESNLSKCVINSDQFNRLLKHTSAEAYPLIFSSMQGRLAPCIQHTYAFNQIADTLPTIEKRASLFQAAMPYLLSVCHYMDDVQDLLVHLPPQHRAHFFNAIEHKIIRFSKNPDSNHRDAYQMVHQQWFNQLLQNIPCPPDAPDNRQAALEVLRNTLQEASTHFFTTPQYTPEGYRQFQTTCQQAINTARPYVQDPGNVLGKLLLAVLTIGLAPAILAIHSKITRGTFNYTLFPNAQEAAVDTLQYHVKHAISLPPKG